MNMRNTKWIQLLAVGLLMMSFGMRLAAQPLPDTSAAGLLKTAQAEARAKNYEKAEQAYRSVVNAPDAQIALKVSAYQGIASIKLALTPPQIPAAIAEYQNALNLPGLPGRNRVGLLSMTAGAYGRLKDWEKAAALYEQVVADPDATNGEKLNALNSMAVNHINQSDMTSAMTTIQRGMALPNLKPAEQLTALKNTGAILERRQDYAAARDTYQQMLAVETSPQNAAAVARLIAGTWVGERDYEKALAAARVTGDPRDLATVYRAQGNYTAANNELRTVLADPKATTPGAVFGQLVQNGVDLVDFATVKADTERFLPQVVPTAPNAPASLLPLLLSAMEKGAFPYAAWAASVVMTAPTLSDKDYRLCRVYLVTALSAQQKLDDARKVAETAGADTRLSAADRARFLLTAAALASTGKAGEMKTACDRTFAAFAAEPLSQDTKATAMLNAAKNALMAGKTETAKELYALRESLFVQDPPRSYVCEFLRDAPNDLSSWLASPVLTDPKRAAKLDRKFGENLAFLLETDVATGNRGAGGGEAQGVNDTGTDMYLACDQTGLHLFFLAADSKVDEVSKGLLGGGSYEGYLAQGHDQPYYCFLINLPSGELESGFRTQYPNRYFRQAQTSNGTVSSTTRATKAGFVTHLFYSWDLFYDKLPHTGDKWQMDVFRWTRSNGYSWAGSKSVHYRSDWGDIIFDGLTDQNLRDIKRGIIYRAWAKFKLERNAIARGTIVYWQDAGVGDPKFYSEVLAPVITQLDELGKKVTPTIADADVDLLFAEAVPGWMDFKYVASDLRQKYLDQKLFAE